MKDNMPSSNPNPKVTPLKEDPMEKITRRLDSLSTTVNNSVEELKGNVKTVETNVIKAIKNSEDKKYMQLEEFKSDWKSVKETVASMNTIVDSLMLRVVDLFSKVGRPSPFPGLTPNLGEEELEKAKISQPKVRKGIIFTDSTNRDIDVERFENSTNSEVEVVTTHRIVENLKTKVNEHMNKEHDFAIFMLGTTDISDMKDMVGVESKAYLQNKCEEQSGKLIEVAEKAAKENLIDVFISEMIPRYDCSSLEQLRKLWSSQLMVKVAGLDTEKLFVVSQGGLSCPTPGRKREELYRDNIHLTHKGIYSTFTNVILSMHEAYSDIRDMPVHVPRSVTSSKEQEAPHIPRPKNADTSQPPPGYSMQGGPPAPGPPWAYQSQTFRRSQPGRVSYYPHQEAHQHRGDMGGKQKTHKKKAKQERSPKQEQYYEDPHSE